MVHIIDANTMKIIGVINSYDNLIWHEKWNAKSKDECGGCEVYARATSDLLQKVKVGTVLAYSKSKMLCRAMSVQITTDAEEGDHIIIKGVDFLSVLAQRIIMKSRTYESPGFRSMDDTLGRYVAEWMDECLIQPEDPARKISLVKNVAHGYSVHMAAEVNYDNLLEKIGTLCESVGYGQRMNFMQQAEEIVPEYSLQMPTENDNCVFFEKIHAVNNSSLTISNEKKKTALYIKGENADEETVIAHMGMATGIERVEGFAESKAEPVTEDGELLSNEAYMDVLTGEAINELKECVTETKFEAEVNANRYEYRKDFNLGDIIKVATTYGYIGRAKIVEVIQNFSANEETTVLTLEYIEDKEQFEETDKLQTENAIDILTESSEKLYT